MLLYTDGLVELPGGTLTDSIEQVCASLRAQQRGTSANDVCEAVLRARPTDKARDDIAMVVVRVLRSPVHPVPKAPRLTALREKPKSSEAPSAV